jgi:hypothetical protein
MHRLFGAALVALCAVGSWSCAQDATAALTAPAGLTGNWRLQWTGKKGKARQAIAHVQQNGGTLSGTVDVKGGSKPLTGTFDGAKVSLQVRGGRKAMAVIGSVRGNTMSGTTSLGHAWTGAAQ